MTLSHQQQPAHWPARFARLFRVFSVALIVVVILSWYMQVPLVVDIKQQLIVLCEEQSNAALLLIGLCYALLLAIPFVPGVELGILIMMVFGKTGVVFAYLCTVAGLSLAYCSGWFMCRQHGGQIAPCQPDALNKAFQRLSQTRGGQWFGGICQRVIIPHRYVSLGVLFNVPGNMVIGGGGGIAMMCGASARFQWPRFVIATMIATSPVPVIFLLGFEVV